MRQKVFTVFKNLAILFLILGVFFAISLTIQHFFESRALIPPLFTLAVFLISLCTDRFYYGIISAIISVLAINYAFTFPFFEFNFSLGENLASAIIMLIVTIATGTLTAQSKNYKAIQAEAEKERMRASLLRAISHDLRTPLTSIYGASSTMIENPDSLKEDSKIRMLQGIQEDSAWLIRLVENLLSITKIENSQVKLIPSSTVLEELVGSVLMKFQKRYPKQEVTLLMPEEFTVIKADPLLIEQVLLNLLENAVQHAVGMTTLSLSISVSDERVFFEIEDDGCGIPKEKLKEVFSGYFVPKDAPADLHKRHMGIGLSLCDTIIKAHDSKISAARSKAGGMLFKFSLEQEAVDNE